MNDVALLLALFVAIAIGWWLGRRQSRVRDGQGGELARRYVRGLNHLLNEQPDNAIDSFIDALEVNPDTLETHLAVGNLLRRRGEVDRAIKVHQNLLARPSLPPEQLHMAQLELGRDYMRAGLLDRAERLFQELVETAPELKGVCLQHLIEIYRDEHEWEKALTAASALAGRRFGSAQQTLAAAQAHFCCELAEQALAASDYLSARRHLKQALSHDRNSVRASLLWGHLEYRLENYREALKQLKRVVLQDPDYLPEVLDLITNAYQHLRDERGLRRFLHKCLEEAPSTSVVLRLSDLMALEQGQGEAYQFLSEQLRQRPSLRGVRKMLDWLQRGQPQQLPETLQQVQQSVDQLLQMKPTYQCRHCGFSGNQLHWLCPSCKHWGTVKPIRGVEGE